jgi:hypothetical protein
MVPGGQGTPPAQVKATEPAPSAKAPPQPIDRKNDQKTPLGPRTKTLVAKLMECDLKLAEAETARERLEALTELAEVLHRETTLLSKSAPRAELTKLAGLYKQVIKEGVVARARELPMPQRKEVLGSVAAELAKTRRDAEKSAQAAPRSAEALLLIAAAAGDGDAQLRQLMREATE